MTSPALVAFALRCVRAFMDADDRGELSPADHAAAVKFRSATADLNDALDDTGV